LTFAASQNADLLGLHEQQGRLARLPGHALQAPRAHRGSVRLAKPLLPDPPSSDEFKVAFRQSYSDTLRSYPQYRFPGPSADAYSTRRWWRELCRRSLELTGRTYSDDDIDRFFRSVYQHYGSSLGYEAYADANDLLAALAAHNNSSSTPEAPSVLVGVTANVSSRTLDTTLPGLGMHDKMHFFTSSQEAGSDKPSLAVFAETLRKLQRWAPGIQKNQVLHVGSSVALDYVAAREFGFSAMLLDRDGAAAAGAAGAAGVGADDLHLQHHLEANTVRGLGEVAARLGLKPAAAR